MFKSAVAPTLRIARRSPAVQTRLITTKSDTGSTPNTASDARPPPANPGTPQNPLRTANGGMLILVGIAGLAGAWAMFRSPSKSIVEPAGNTALGKEKGNQVAMRG